MLAQAEHRVKKKRIQENNANDINEQGFAQRQGGSIPAPNAKVFMTNYRAEQLVYKHSAALIPGAMKTNYEDYDACTFGRNSHIRDTSGLYEYETKLLRSSVPNFKLNQSQT